MVPACRERVRLHRSPGCCVRRLSLRERHRRVKTLRVSRRPHYDHRTITHQASETPTKQKPSKHIVRVREWREKRRRLKKRTLPSSPVVDHQYYAEHLGKPKISSEKFSFSSTGGAVWDRDWDWDLKRTSRGITFYVGLDAHHLLKQLKLNALRLRESWLRPKSKA